MIALSLLYFATQALVSVRVFSIAPALSGESPARSRVNFTCSITAVVCSVYLTIGSPPKPNSACAGAGNRAVADESAKTALNATERRDVVAWTWWVGERRRSEMFQ